MAGEAILERVDLAQRARTWGLQDPLAGIEFDGQDFIAEFLDYVKTIGRAEDTIDNYGHVLRDFQTFLSQQRGGKHIGKANEQDVVLWKKHLDERGLALTTKNTALILLKKFFQYLVDSPYYPHQHNPVTMVKASLRMPHVRPKRREISVEEMAKFVHSVKHVRDRALIVLLLKTGMRRSECANLRLKHIVLDDNLKGKINGIKPKCVYIEAGGKEGTEGTKRKIDTVIPLDEEAIQVLKVWLAARPTDSESDRLFVQLTTRGALDPARLSYIVRDHVANFGWWKRGADMTQKVTTHFFRHWAVTQWRIRGMPDALVHYLRGDSVKSILEVYTHLTWDYIKENYERYIYKFGI